MQRSLQPFALFYSLHLWYKENSNCLLKNFEIKSKGLAKSTIAQAMLNKTADKTTIASQRKEDKAFTEENMLLKEVTCLMEKRLYAFEE